MEGRQIYIVIGLVVLGAALWYYYSQKKTEGYLAPGALDNLSSLDGRYELIEAPDAAVKSEHFADLVDAGDQQRLINQIATGGVERPLERLEKLQQTQLLPPTSAHLPQYNIDTANVSVYAFAVNAPRVILKNRLNNQADPFRGDVPIRYHPDVPLIAKSSNGRDSWRGDGFFSDHFASLYNKLTGRAYKNMPLRTATEGTVLDYVGSD
jgi:hypothetical protein